MLEGKQTLRRKWSRPHLPTTKDSPFGTWQKLRLLLVIVAFGDLLAAAYYFWNSAYLGRGYPYNTFLFLPRERFSDFENMVIMCRDLNPYHDGTQSGYPPFANLFYYLFSPFSTQFGYTLYLIPPVMFVIWACKQTLSHLSLLRQLLTIVFICIFSYPFLFAFDRGNLEFYLMISSGSFLIFYNSRQEQLRQLSCIALAFAISLKVYPASLLLLLLKDRRFLDCLKVFILCEVLSVGSAAFFKGGAWNAECDSFGMLAGVDQLAKGNLDYGHFNSGIFYGVVIVLKCIHGDSILEWFTGHYWIIASFLLMGYSALILRARLSSCESAICVVCLMCLLPSLSNDYRTLQILVPMLLYVSSRTAWTNTEYLILLYMGLLLVPRNYWIMLPEVGAGDIGIGSVITPLILIGLLNTLLFGKHRGNREQTFSGGRVEHGITGLTNAS
jgi:hypothetical protein